MRLRLRHLWSVISSGYWFVPTVMMACAVVMSLVLLFLDRNVIDSDTSDSWVYGGGADGARVLLSTLAGSVITVAGVVFSITIVALTQASAQFGPRLLRNFMRDTGNQVVLGTFVATFVYCLLILRTIRGDFEGGTPFIPQASITTGVLLAAASIAVLVFFIHHVSVSLQAPAVVGGILAEMEEVISRLKEDQTGASAALMRTPDGLMPPDFDDASVPVIATRQGYIQAMNYGDIIAAASSADLILRLEYRPGDYVIEGSALLRAWPADRWDQKIGERLNGAFICGRHPTPEQDVEYAIRQIVEVAVRALSPGVNDPFTAINCIDALGTAICRIARQGLPGPLRYDEQGRLRVVTRVTTLEGVIDGAFNQIRQYGRNSVAVTIRLLEVIAKCGEQLTAPEQRDVLFRHADMVYHQSQEAVAEPRDRKDIQQRWDAIVRAFGAEDKVSVTVSPIAQTTARH